MPLANRSNAKPLGQAGSAYIVTLLALVILTILVLTLTLVTQSEVAIGGTEKTTNRTLYAADSGLGFAAPKVMLGDASTDTFILNRTIVGLPGANQSNLADRVTVDPPVAIDSGPTDWGNAAIGKNKWTKTAYIVSSKSERIGWTGNVVPDAATPVQIFASKTVDYQLDIQPSPPPDTRAYQKYLDRLRSAVAPPPL